MITKFDELKWYKDALQKQLKPCPFCNGIDLHIHVPNKDNKEDVMCCTCGATITRALGVGVIQAWNKRS